MNDRVIIGYYTQLAKKFVFPFFMKQVDHNLPKNWPKTATFSESILPYLQLDIGSQSYQKQTG